MAISVTRATPPTNLTGFTVASAYGYEIAWTLVGSTYTDVTTALKGGAGATVLASSNDYLIIGKDCLPRDGGGNGDDSRWANIHLAFSSASGSDAGLLVEYYTGSSWATMNVTDGTNGLTQDGSITFNWNTFPTYSAWAAGTMNDAVYRAYVRISRSSGSAPTISELGIGALEDTATYYYDAQRVTKTPYSNGESLNRYHRSDVAGEASATTTSVKRSIKISWDAFTRNQVIHDGVIVFRRPDGLDTGYKGASEGVVYQSYLSSQAQHIKGQYFHPLSGSTGKPAGGQKWTTHDYVYDDGVIIMGTYNATYNQRSYYTAHDYVGRSISTITVSGGTDGGEASFNDIRDAASSDWGFETLSDNHDPPSNYYFSLYYLGTGSWRMFYLWDNLFIEDYFKDGAFVLNQWGELNTQTCTKATFGYYTDGTYNNGAVFIFSGGAGFGSRSWYVNSEFYNIKFCDDPWGFNRLYRYQYIGDGCIFKDCSVKARSTWEKFSPLTSDITFDNFRIAKLRYGFYFNGPTAIPSLDHFSCEGGTSFYLNSTWASDSTIEIANYKVSSSSAVCNKWYANAGYGLVVLRLISPEFGPLVRHTGDTYPGNYYYYYALGADTFKIEVAHKPTIKVADSDQVAISGATVTVVNNAGGTDTYTTDGSGEAELLLITDTHTKGRLYSGIRYYMDTETILHPFTITISKSGYQNYSFTASIDDSKDIHIELVTANAIIFADAKPIYNLKKADPDNKLLYTKL